MSVLANKSLSRENALPVRALVKQGWFTSAGAAMPVEAPPCSALCPDAAGGTRAQAGELILPGRCGRGAEVVAEPLLPAAILLGPRSPSTRSPVQPVSALSWSNLGAALSCSLWPAVGTVVRDQLRVDPQPCLLRARRVPQPSQGTAHQHSWEQGPAPRRLLAGGRH